MGGTNTDSRLDGLQDMSSGVKFVMTQDEMIFVTLTDIGEVERVLNSIPIFARLKGEKGLVVRDEVIEALKTAIVGMSPDIGYKKSDFLATFTKAFGDNIYLKGHVFVVIEALFGEVLASDLRSFVLGNQNSEEA